MIAQKSGLTKCTLYYYFRSKDDLLAGVFELHRGLALKRIIDWFGTLSGDVDRPPAQGRDRGLDRHPTGGPPDSG